MIIVVQKIYSALVSLFAIPFAYYAKLPISPWQFFLCTHLASIIPFYFGDLFRYWFYKNTLKYVGKKVKISFGTIIQSRDCSIGDRSSIGLYNILSNVTIGADVMLAARVIILGGRKEHGIDRLDIPMKEQDGVISHVIIGNDVWIGTGAIISENVGSGCIVGMGSIVVKPINDYDIVVGNPAKFLKNRKNV